MALDRIYFLVTYAKNEQDNLTPSDTAAIHRLVMTLEAEGR